MKVGQLLWIPALVLGHTIPGIDSIQKQLVARDTNPIDALYNNLNDTQIDWITKHVNQLQKFNGSKCATCKNDVVYAKTLLQKEPENSHLISLVMFKVCLINNKNKESKCDNKDFFITTNSENFEMFNDNYNSGIHTNTGLNFQDNDYLNMLKRFNTSSQLDLEYYCYFKQSACDLPETPDVDHLYNISSWWPAKQSKQEQQPDYGKENLKTFNVLHFSDFHIQLRYKLGSEANCTGSLCCLPESVNTDLPGLKHYNFTDSYSKLNSLKEKFELSFYPDAHYDKDGNYILGEYYDYPKTRGWDFVSEPASIFGSYLCDAPELLINNTLKSILTINKNENFEFAIFTGDLVDHDVIHCTPNATKEAEIKGFQIMKHYLNDIPVFPSLGNHDTYPYGQLAINGVQDNGYDWNVELMADLWVNQGWLNGTNASQIRQHYSGFSYVTDRGLKVIGLNSNCYYQKNLWSYIDLLTNPDLYGQWKFLVQELLESEAKGQRVWIMAHIPPSDPDVLPIQSQIFSKIIERFSPYTIATTFFGHTHRDQVNLAYKWNHEKSEENVINMGWVAQSVTPDSDNNPSWRYYEVEDKSFNIMNTYNYYIKLNDTFTNGGAEPIWNFEYSARETYDSQQQWPKDAPLNATFWHKFVASKLANESDIAFNQLYSDLQYRHSPFTPNCTNGTEVSEVCQSENYCVVGNFYSFNRTKCSD